MDLVIVFDARYILVAQHSHVVESIACYARLVYDTLSDSLSRLGWFRCAIEAKFPFMCGVSG